MKFLLILFLPILIHSQVEKSFTGSQVITEDEIKSAGIVNISDIISLVDKWNASTIDGFTWYVSPNGLSDYQRQNLLVFVDGQRIELIFFDNQNLNLLPFSVKNISYIEIINSPQILMGYYASSGAIHFHLKEPVRNLTSHLSYAAGNETGDPGPYKFTQFTSPNVDKINFLLSMDLNYRSKNWFLSGGIKQEENFDTDENLKGRLQRFSSTLEKARLVSSFGKLKTQLYNSENNIFAFYTSSHDYLFFKPFGNELPVRKVLLHGGVNGHSNITDAIGIKYNFKVSDNRLVEWQNINLDWHLVNISSGVEGVYKSGNSNLNLGLYLDNYTVLTENKLSDNSILLRRIYLSYAFSSGRFNQQIHSMVVKDLKEYSFKNSLISSILLNTSNSISSIFSFSNRTLNEDLNYWTWYNRNYSIKLKAPTDIITPSEIGKKSLFTGDLIYIYNIDSTTISEAGLSFRIHRGYIEKQSFQFEDNYFISPTEIVNGNTVKIIGANASVKSRISNKVSGKVNYSYQKTLSGGDIYKSIWEAFPQHHITLTLDYKPVSSFGIWARLNYFSREKWNEYNYIQYQSGSKFKSEVKRGPLLDISFHKWFGKKAVWVNMVFRNILNQKEYYHPAGAQFDLRFFLQVNINLDYLPE